jgi:hypothetical protein
MRTALFAAAPVLAICCLVQAAAPTGPTTAQPAPVFTSGSPATGVGSDHPPGGNVQPPPLHRAATGVGNAGANVGVTGGSAATGVTSAQTNRVTRSTIPPIEIRRQQVMQILRLIQPNQQDVRVAEAALAAAGKENLPILQELKDHPDRLVADDELTTNTYSTIEGWEFTDMRPREARAKDLAALRLKAVEAVINQFSQGFDPKMAIEKWGGDKPARFPPQPLKDDNLARLFGDTVFYGLTFPEHPPMMPPPAPYKQHNLFAIDRKGSVEDLTTKAELEAWFSKHLAAVKDEAAAKAVMRAWMACTQPLLTDGFFRFFMAEDTLVVEKTDKELKASGRLDVDSRNGDRGSVSVTLTFDADGKLGPVSQENTLKAGMRPICQSTKLLDPDPLVRRMAEDCLMIMGTDAFPYLMDQRAKSTPELQQAIDGIMQRVINRE